MPLSGIYPAGHEKQSVRARMAGVASLDPPYGSSAWTRAKPALAKGLPNALHCRQPIRARRKRTMHYKRISADCHLDMPCMPPELFVENASREMKERMPYV